MSRGTRIGVGVVVAVIVIGGLALMGRASAAHRAVDVRMDKVGRRDLAAVVTASGQIEAKTDVDISADVTARITHIHVKEGDMVKKGELLIELDQTQFEGAVDQGKATLAQAQAGELTAKANRTQALLALNRLKQLQKAEPANVTQQDVDNSQTAFEVADANLKSAHAIVEQNQAALKQAQDNLGHTMIYSPISGRVVRVAHEEGEVAVPGTFSAETGLLMRVADMSVILAKVKVDETDVVRLALGDSAAVSIDAFPDTTFIGRVTKIGNSESADASGTTATTGTDKAVDFDVEVTLKNPPRDVRPDLSMTARIVTDVRKNALAIPIIALTARPAKSLTTDVHPATPMTATPADSAALRKDQDGVFVVENGIARFRPVKVGIAGDEYFEVLDGLKEGETIVTGSYETIRDMKDSTRVRQTTTVTTPVKH